MRFLPATVFAATNHAMTTLPIPVDERTANAFNSAAPSTQHRITDFVSDYLRAALLSDAEQARAYGQAADALSASAEANGWTDSLNEALLRGDLDAGE